LVKKVAGDLSKELNTKVTIKKVDFRFFDKILLKELMVEDRQKDTLLYAATASANITDWFFIKDKVTLYKIGLENTVVNMQRTDSVWNYQFLVDYFSSPRDPNRPKKKGVAIDIENINLKNIRFNKMDKWVGQDMMVILKLLDVNVEKMDLNNKEIFITDINMKQPVFSQSDFDGNKPAAPNLSSILNTIPVVNALRWNQSGWKIKLGKLNVIDGSFINNIKTKRAPYTDHFDGQHIGFSGINGSLSNITFINDTLQADISLKAKERSGLEVKKLESHMRFTPVLMEFQRLDLQTNKSKLGDYYAMRYNSFNKDMGEFINSVTIEANFKESVLSSDDLAIFAPTLLNMKRVFYLEGNAKGTIDNFSAQQMKIRTGGTFLDGDVSMRGLPDIETTFIDLRSRTFKTNYNELVAIIPALKNVQTPALNKLGAIQYAGNFTGFINDFVAFGNIQTNLGKLTADLNMKLPENGPALYSGNINTASFNLGSFLNDPNFGSIAINGAIKGSDFAIEKLNASFNGKIARLDYGGYSYRNISMNGNLKNKLFKGKLAIDDPNIQITDLDGEISFAGKRLAFNADADIKKIDFKNIGFTNDELILSGEFNLDFTGNNIDEFLGSAIVSNAKLEQDGTPLSFDSLALRSFIVNGQKTLTLQSNEVDASISGNFQILKLPDAFKEFLSRYYPTYIKAPTSKVENQDFSFNIKTNKIDEYLQLVDQKIEGFNNSQIEGSINLGNNELYLNAVVPEFSYDGKIFINTKLLGNGNGDTLFVDVNVEDIVINDSLHFPETTIKLAAHNDVSLVQLNTKAGKTLNAASLNASVQTLEDGVRVSFFPSSFVLNNKEWTLEKDGELTLRKNYIDATEIRFKNNDQEIVLGTELDEVTDGVHLFAKLKNVVIEDFLPFWVTDPDMSGKLTGATTITDLLGNPKIAFKGVADSFSLNKKYVGKVTLDGGVNTSTGMVIYKANTGEVKNTFAIDGHYNYKDSTGNKMNTQLIADKIDLNLLEPFLTGVFDKIDGSGKANLLITDKDSDHMTLVGDVTVDTASVKIGFTQVKYQFRNEKIIFGRDVIDFGNISISDTLRNKGTVSGKMYHQFFDDFSFENVRVETGKMLLLNTTKKDNPQFYGDVIGNALMTMNGSLSNLVMNINGQPSSLDSSHIYLNTDVSTRENADVDYIDFTQFGSEMNLSMYRKKTTNFLVNMNITANPACKVDLILDEETGDIIKGQGTGKLNIRLGSTEPLSIRGKYDITQGRYTFNFQTFIKKEFLLSKGSITWNGDPLLALIDIEARYTAPKVDVSSITQNSGTNNVRRKEDIIIVSHLEGSLANPTIGFEFLLPPESNLNQDYFTVKKLADFKNNEDERNKQVASLLLVNSFIGDQSIATGVNTVNITAGLLGGVVSGFLTNLLNKELERATNGVISTYVDINPTVDLQVSAKQLQANVRAGLKIFFSSRINLILGGNIDYNNPFLANSGIVTPDITIEWLLNNDGSLRVVGFNRTGVDLTSLRRNRSGMQLSYRKDFNKLSDIFKSRKKLREQENSDSIFVRRLENSN
jgi:hypothetical protein